MPALDIRSLMLTSVVAALALAAVLAFTRHYYPQHIRGIGHWAAATLVWALAAALFSATGLVHPFVASTLPNALLLAGFVLYYVGCRAFLGRSARWLAASWPPALALVAAAWFTYGDPSWAAQLSLIILATAGMEIAIFALLQRHGPPSLPARMIQVACVGQLLVIAYRLWTTLSGRAGVDMMDRTFEQALLIGSFAPVLTVMCFGTLLLATDQAVSELRHQITHDPLTGALNRRALALRCEAELERCRRGGQTMALLMLDLDHFKAINDTHGHQHGDAVLVHFARSIRELLRASDLLGRYGGEEFVVALPEAGTDQAQAAAERIHQALARGHALDCACSIGLTSWSGSADTLDAMLARADEALYRAKAGGRNRTCRAEA